MKNTLLQWHLARDNSAKLFLFLHKNAIKEELADIPELNKVEYMGQKYHYFEFDNGAWVIVETCYNNISTTGVVDYAWGKAYASAPAYINKNDEAVNY